MVARLVVAAPASGHGKTSVATGLLAAFAARGLTVSPHKIGPDYIDPGYHALAAGRPGRTLDPWLVGEERILPLFRHGAASPAPADLAVIEGVMGLHDGAAGRGEFASTAHVARLLGAPVLLVVDCTAIGRSVAAMVAGYAGFDPRLRIGGVVLNRVGSDRHEMILREALAEIGIPVVGALRRHDALATPSRHLGLVPVAERAASALETVRALGEVVQASVDLDAVLRLARSAPSLSGPEWDPAAEVPTTSGPRPVVAVADEVTRLAGSGRRPVVAVADEVTRLAGSGRRPVVAVADEVTRLAGSGRRPVVAVAGGPAFTFSYAETAELLTAAGADVVTFDPLHEPGLPAGCAGLVIGGGFPEVYAAQLAANVLLRQSVSDLAASGAPIAAECAGLLYLARSLDGAPMCGVIGTDAVMTGRLTLGYREAIAASDSVLAPAGARARGHEFHRTACTPGAPGRTGLGEPADHLESADGPAWSWAAPDGTERLEGFTRGNVHASYLHLHWAGQPGMASRFVAAARDNAVRPPTAQPQQEVAR